MPVAQTVQQSFVFHSHDSGLPISSCLGSWLFLLQTALFSGAIKGVCRLRAHALGAERDVEVYIINIFEQNGANET